MNEQTVTMVFQDDETQRIEVPIPQMRIIDYPSRG
jgi:hypothetical protein